MMAIPFIIKWCGEVMAQYHGKNCQIRLNTVTLITVTTTPILVWCCIGRYLSEDFRVLQHYNCHKYNLTNTYTHKSLPNGKQDNVWEWHVYISYVSSPTPHFVTAFVDGRSCCRVGFGMAKYPLDTQKGTHLW